MTTLWSYLFDGLNNLMDNYYIEPILLVALLSAVMGHYKKELNFKIKDPILKDICEWIASFVFSLAIVAILDLIGRTIWWLAGQL